RCQVGALLAFAKGDNFRVVGRAFVTAVPTVVVVGTVAVAFLIRLVVLAVIRHKIVQAESVVAGDEVDAGDRLASVPAIQVAGAEKPRREVGGDPAVALPEPSDRVAVLAVPFAPHV